MRQYECKCLNCGRKLKLLSQSRIPNLEKHSQAIALFVVRILPIQEF